MSQHLKVNSTLWEQIKGLDNRFWIVNVIEMFERLAYYGVRAVVALYMVLPKELGGPQFTHVEKGIIFAWWAGFQSVLPMFIGGFADRYGHKRTIVVSIILDIIGYLLMANLKSFWGFFVACMCVAIGTAVFKPGLQGTLAATLKKSSASLGWGIFYQLVNIGGFLGPVVAGFMRLMDWKYVFYSSAFIISLNFLWLPFYEDPSKEFNKDKKLTNNPLKIFINSILGLFRPRVFFFCMIFSGFWLMFNQVFDLLPNVIDDWVDSRGIIMFLGTLFSYSALSYILALVVSIILSGIVVAIILIALREDKRSIDQVPQGSYVVIFIALCASFLLLFLNFKSLFSYNIILGLSVVLSLILTLVFKISQSNSKIIGGSGFVIALLGAFFLLSDYFSSNAQNLIRLAQEGKQVNPEWLINLNPALIVLTMVFFAYLTSFLKPLTSIIIGMFVATLGSIIAGTASVGFICVAGILVFSIGEMLSSPKKMEYLASLCPKGQEGLYMGYVNIPVAIGWITGSVFANTRYEQIGDKVNLAKAHMIKVLGIDSTMVNNIPKSEVMTTLAQHLNMSLLEAQKFLFNTYHPYRIWFEIASIGVLSMIGMIIYDRVLRYYDAKHSKNV